MHTVLLHAAGAMLLAVFCLLGYLWGRGTPDVIRAAWAFLPVWGGLALVNLWIGGRHAGYPLSAELPVLCRPGPDGRCGDLVDDALKGDQWLLFPTIRC